MFDEEWKDLQFGGVEGHWGLFDKQCVLLCPFSVTMLMCMMMNSRKMKNLKLPTCLLKS